MNQEEAGQLLDRYLQGKANPQEEAIVQSWLMQQTSANQKTGIDEYSLPAEMWDNVYQSIHPKRSRLWPRIAAVAAAVAMVVFGVWFFSYRGEILRDALDDKSVVVNDIAPGKNGATITLANGKVIQLSDAKSGVVIGNDKLAYNDGSAVGALSASGGEMPEGQRGGSAVAKEMTASTTKGQTYIFTLPDGTKVWLNAASSLTIPSDFSGIESRKVELSGEAYFEVAKNKKRPFIVATAGGNGVPGQEVTVLGTHFNINAYEDEGAIKTTLLEGSVRVAKSPPYQGGVPEGGGGRIGKTTPATPPFLAKEGTSIVLKPNQQSLITGNTNITVKQVDVTEVVSWKEGYYKFDKEPLESIMQKIVRWYNVDVIYTDPALKTKVFSGSVSRYDNISGLLGAIQKTSVVKFRIEGRKVYIEQ